MSIFYCHGCDQLRDSDEGCEEIRGELLCQRCVDKLPEPTDDPVETLKEQHTAALRAEALKHGIVL